MTMLAPGSRLGPYEIRAAIGAGGMGEVYRARDTRLLRDVAVKVIPEAVAAQPEMLARFQREAQAVASISHSNIVVIHDVGRDGSTSYIVMELLEGETLRARLRRGPIPEKEAIALARQIAGALAAAHAKGVIHRDLKPENLLVSGDTIKVLDFGLARAEGAPAPAFESTAPTAVRDTAQGVILGTFGYMSPEQVRGASADQRSDLFAFGAVLYEMLTGESAFRGDSAVERATAVLRDRPDLSTAHVDPRVAALTARCLEKDPQARFQSAHDVLDALEGLAGNSRAAPAAQKASPEETPSIAVLPFADLSPKKDQQYFCEGMADEIITALAGLKGLRVASRTSSVRCQEKGLDAAEIGARLNVRFLVEGTVRQAGTRVRITAQLTKVADGYQAWAERYDRNLDDVFAVQDEIAKAIAEKLRVSLGSSPDAALVKQGTQDPEAYALYLQGRYQFARRNRWRLRIALESFQRAIERDAKYAQSHAGVADCYAVMGAYGVQPGPQLAPPGRAAAERALLIGPDLAESHHADAALRVFCEMDVPGAERSLRRSLEISPDHAISHAYLGLTQAVQGRFDDALARARRATDLEPDSPILHYISGGVALWARDLDLSERLTQRSLDLDEGAAFAFWTLGLARLLRGDGEGAIRLAERACDIGERQPLALSGLGFVTGRTGDAARATTILAELESRRAHEYIAPMWIGDVLFGLGRLDDAAEQYERAYDERNGFLIRIATSPEYDPIRSHPRILALLRKMKISAYAERSA